MTRARQIDPAILEREYIYDSGTPSISLTELAEKHGLARSNVTAKAQVGRWYERRVEFRKQLGEKTIAALGDSWVAFETATREKMMQVGLSYLDKYVKALEAGEIKANTRDMLGIAAMIRALMQDTAARPREEGELLDPDAVPFTEDRARDILRQLEAGDDGPSGDLAPTGTEGSRQN